MMTARESDQKPDQRADLIAAVFAKRGIPERIWRARPYVPWTPDDCDDAKLRHADLLPNQRAGVANTMRQSAGLAIVRYAAPMDPPLPRIYPELRPDESIETHHAHDHWHGDGPPPAGLEWWQVLPGKRANWQAHIDRDKADDDHHGHNVETLHSHKALAKYVFPPSAKMDGAYVHDHADGWKMTATKWRAAKRESHIAKWHPDGDVLGPHTHAIRVKDPDADNLAKRIDVHPFALPLLKTAPVIFFVIEGCLKADAVLADGGAVFSVPSVSLWDCDQHDELERFVNAYLLDKTVIIVPDSDWHDKGHEQVDNQAKMCKAKLLRLGVARAHVAAPPPADVPDKTGSYKQGVDDFIGAGRHLEDLEVIDSNPAPGLSEYVRARASRRDQADRDIGILWALTSFTGPSGVFKAPLRTLARVLDVRPMTACRAVDSLERMGAVTVERTNPPLHPRDSLDARPLTEPIRDHFTGEYRWRHPNTITLAAELRPADVTDQRLGDRIALPLRAAEVLQGKGSPAR
jgi:hypothetical protein